MIVELSEQQRNLLLRLVDEEIRELGPEIHHTRTYKDPLKEQKRELQTVRDLLAGAAPPDTRTAAQAAPPDPIGLA